MECQLKAQENISPKHPKLGRSVADKCSQKEKIMDIGLKVFFDKSPEFISAAKEFFERGVIDYIEIQSPPDYCPDKLRSWQSIGCEFVVHAAHHSHGFNPANRSLLAHNEALVEWAKRVADQLDSDTIIVHGGHDGPLQEVVRQFMGFSDERIVIENMPVCPGRPHDLIEQFNCATSDEIEVVMDMASVGHCFDLSHAVCAANSLKKEPVAFVKSFLALSPRIFHLCDGAFDSTADLHLNFGHGNYPLKKILKLYPEFGRASIETNYWDYSSLSGHERDFVLIREILQKRSLG